MSNDLDDIEPKKLRNNLGYFIKKIANNKEFLIKL